MFINVRYTNVLEQESYFSVTLVISLLFGIIVLNKFRYRFFTVRTQALLESSAWSCISQSRFRKRFAFWLFRPNLDPRFSLLPVSRGNEVGFELSCCVCHYSVSNANLKRVGSVTEGKRILLHFERLKVLRFRKRKGNPTVTQ